MNKKARNATLIGIAAGVVLVPLVRLAIRKYRSMKAEPVYEGAPPNNLFSAYRGKFKPHRRKAADNGAQ